MKKEELYKEIGYVDPDIIEEADSITKKGFMKRNWIRVASIAACLVVLVAVAIPLVNEEKKSDGDKVTITNRPSEEMAQFPDLSEIKGGAKVQYVEDIPMESVSADLAQLSLDDIFHKMNTAIFMGTVKEVRNIEIAFGNYTEYRALVQIQVTKVYRGEMKEGDIIMVLLPCGINTGVWVEDTDVVSQIQEGVTGIFMPTIYDKDSYMEMDGIRLNYQDLGDYGFSDGERFAFLQLEKGLALSTWQYPELEKATTLDEVEQYILKQLQ